MVTGSLLYHCGPGQNLLLKPLDQFLYVDLEQGYRVLKGRGHGKAQCSPDGALRRVVASCFWLSMVRNWGIEGLG